MEDTEDDAGYPPHPHHHHHRTNKHRGRSFPVQDLPPPRLRYSRSQEDDELDEEEDDDLGASDPDQNGIDENEDENEEDDDDDDDEDDEDEVLPLMRKRKKRRLDRLALGFEFAPRAPPRNSPADWSEDSTFLLLDAWGDLFLRNGRKSVRSEDWTEVARKVSQSSRIPRSESQCRNRLDTLKKKYKKEKTSSTISDWIYFSKMDSLLSSASSRIPCGFDSGEYVFMNSQIYASRSNDLDEMRDTPADSDEDEEEDEDESEGLPPATSKSRKDNSFRMLADSIKKFGEIYEKIEESKRRQMAELGRMRKEFQEDLELQKRQILERAQAEMEKMRQNSDDEDEEMEVSHEEGSA